jgi:hypothetical protein
MPSINIRQLRDTRQLEAWLQAGEVVELRKRNRVLGRIMPQKSGRQPKASKWPDFGARLKRNFGERILPVVEDMIAERNSRY